MVLGFKRVVKRNGKRVKTYFEEKIVNGSKIHTVRRDSKNRWSPGKVIHFATGIRTPDYDNFMMGKCISIQEIIIETGNVFIDGRHLDDEELLKFANNDGFDTMEDFWDWFYDYQPFKGKLIHWTDFTY